MTHAGESSMLGQIRRSFESRDLATLALLLADDVRWGDDDHPRKCRSRSDVLDTFTRRLGEGVSGEITELAQGSSGVLCGLSVHWPEGMSGDDRVIYQVYLLRDGLIAEIRRYDDRPNAARAAGLS